MRFADLPLHTGKAPPWLFRRMVKMAGLIGEWIIEEHGTSTFLERLSSPFWFQAFACALGFDWHSSGTTSTAIGALREGLKNSEMSIYGGKGKMSREIPEEIKEETALVHAMFSAGLDDGYSMYISSVMTDGKDFVVIDQGMNLSRRYARRYHWHSKFRSFSDEENIAGIEGEALNTISKRSESVRKLMLDLVEDNYFIKCYNAMRGQKTLFSEGLELPRRHEILAEDLSARDIKLFSKLAEEPPENFGELLKTRGLGAKKVRALALVANLVYGEELDWRDPVKYSFAHGGKDGIPFPVDKQLYDENISLIEEAVEECKANKEEKRRALKKLADFTSLIRH